MLMTTCCIGETEDGIRQNTVVVDLHTELNTPLPRDNLVEDEINTPTKTDPTSDIDVDPVLGWFTVTIELTPAAAA